MLRNKTWRGMNWGKIHMRGERAVLGACRLAFGATPRNFSWWERWSYLYSFRPLWCTPGDPLGLFFRRRADLIARGRIVWGVTVQANGLLFEPGPADHPGEVVYSLDESVDAPLTSLVEIAARLYALKGTEPSDPEQAAIADYLTQETARHFGLPAPSTLTGGLPCAMSSVVFARRHLPNRRLSRGVYPLLLSPEEPRIAMPLPSRYWAAPFREWWIREPSAPEK